MQTVGWEGNPVKDAIAEQEEHIKRTQSCGVTGRPHRFASFRPAGSGSIPAAEMWSACVACSVTETAADYARQQAAHSV